MKVKIGNSVIPVDISTEEKKKEIYESGIVATDGFEFRDLAKYLCLSCKERIRINTEVDNYLLGKEYDHSIVFHEDSDSDFELESESESVPESVTPQNPSLQLAQSILEWESDWSAYFHEGMERDFKSVHDLAKKVIELN